jgi:hypothetical protein
MKIKSCILILCIAGMAISPSRCVLGQSPGPSSSPQLERPPSGAMRSSPPSQPDMGAMMGQMMSVMFDAQTSPEHATRLAHFQKLYYDALLKEGFTKDEALGIVKAAQPPMMGAK